MFAPAVLLLAELIALPAPRLEIAARVAASGHPRCTSYLPDGTTRACQPLFALRPGRRVNAWSLDGRIAFTRAAAERLSPDEFALLAGHELAHWHLGHRSPSRANELAADRLGAELACRAGYDPAAGATLFRHLAPDAVHPPAAERRAAVAAVRCG